jgi:5,10-methenyltetrahydromethanopterin hydrogenase
MTFFVPGRVTVGMGLSAITYAGELRIGCAADESIMNDPSLVVSLFHKAIDQFEKIAKVA